LLSSSLWRRIIGGRGSLKGIILVLCGAVWALGAGAVSAAQTGPATAPVGAATGVVGTARVVDETTLVIGEPTAAGLPSAQAAGPSTLDSFLRMLLVLALILAAVYGVFRLIRRLSSSNAAGESPIKILATAPLGQNRSLHVVSLGSKAWLVGSAESSVSLIAEIEDKETMDTMALQASTAPRAKGFAETLASLLPGKARRGPDRGAGYLARQRERLRKF
jgi:flagellar protein FliO/FliZ